MTVTDCLGLGHGHTEPGVAWHEVYLYDDRCACGCPLLSCPVCDCARCFHCQPMCAAPGPTVR